MLVNRHVAARQCGSPAHRLDLQGEGQKADRVVRVDRALELKRENQVQIAAAPKHKGIAPLRRHGLKTAVELGDVGFAQKPVGGFERADFMQPELLRQAPLPGSEVAFAATACLRRVGRNHLDTEVAQRPSYLRWTMRVDLAAHLRRQPEMATPIAIQGAEYA